MVKSPEGECNLDTTNHFSVWASKIDTSPRDPGPVRWKNMSFTLSWQATTAPNFASQYFCCSTSTNCVAESSYFFFQWSMQHLSILWITTRRRKRHQGLESVYIYIYIMKKLCYLFKFYSCKSLRTRLVVLHLSWKLSLSTVGITVMGRPVSPF